MALTLQQVHQKFGKQAVTAVISPIGKDGIPKHYHRHPYSLGLLEGLTKGSKYRVRLYAKETRYLLTFSFTR